MDLANGMAYVSLDAAHLAAAPELAARCLAVGATPLLVITADAEPDRAAAAEGQPVDDPNATPNRTRAARGENR